MFSRWQPLATIFFLKLRPDLVMTCTCLCGMQLARHLLLTDVVISQIKGMIRQLHSYETMGFNFCSERGSDIKQWK